MSASKTLCKGLFGIGKSYEVNVIVHKTPGKERDAVLPRRVAEKTEIDQPVTIREEHCLISVSPLHNVMRMIQYYYSC